MILEGVVISTRLNGATDDGRMDRTDQRPAGSCFLFLFLSLPVCLNVSAAAIATIDRRLLFVVGL